MAAVMPAQLHIASLCSLGYPLAVISSQVFLGQFGTISGDLATAANLLLPRLLGLIRCLHEQLLCNLPIRLCGGWGRILLPLPELGMYSALEIRCWVPDRLFHCASCRWMPGG